MCDCHRPAMTLKRALASIKAMSPTARAELRRRLNTAPAPPSLRDAIQQARAPQSRDERLRAALTAGQSPITPKRS